jgi:outer membrane protein, adhesin transport system
MYRAWAIFAGAMLWASGDASAMSLREAVETAVTTNPRIEAAQANQRATQEVLNQATGRLFPEIDLRADYGKQRIDRPLGLGPDVNNVWRNRRQVTASVRQVVFDGFDRAYDIYRSQARISAATQKVIARSEAVALNAVESYIDVNRHEELLALAFENVERHTRLAEIIRANFDGGNAPLGDLEQTEERLQSAQAFVSQIRVALESARAKFKNAVGVAPSRLGHVPYASDIPGNVDAVVEMALSHNPRIRAGESEIDVAQFDREQFKSTLYPQISLEGSATRGEDLEGTPGRNDELRGMVVLSWKLFDGGVRLGRVRELSERYSERIAEQGIMLRDLRQDIEIAWARLTEGRAQVNAIRKQVEQNEKVVETYLDEYNAGNRNLLDVLDAENAGFASKFELSNVSALHVYSSYQLLAQMGLLLDSLNVIAPTMLAEYPDPLPGFAPVRSSSAFAIPPLSGDEN